MQLPKLTKEDVADILLECDEVGESLNGGQKLVFPCIINGSKYAIKFLLVTRDDTGEFDNSEEYQRCKREIDVLKACNSDHLITLGPVGLTKKEYGGENIIYYSEPWVEGKNLFEILNDRNAALDEEDVIKIGVEISYAIEELWNHHKIHRDIKPQNIMQDQINDRYILLDMGMSYDSFEDSLTKYGCLPGTMGYCSPEQLNLIKKRDLDFRSDLFCLGIVMYLLATNIHPFLCGAKNDEDVFCNIANKTPPAPNSLNATISIPVSNVIMRLLSKRPAGRYRKCELLRNDLERV